MSFSVILFQTIRSILWIARQCVGRQYAHLSIIVQFEAFHANLEKIKIKSIFLPMSKETYYTSNER